ncbi:MAG: peptide chain release factor 2 [Firmicutes bacterium]|nr:peptide chain release factor 2 [Bacillota bacterium]
MLITENIRIWCEEVKEKLTAFTDAVNNKNNRLEVAKKSQENDWQNIELAKEIKDLESFVEHYTELIGGLDDLGTLLDMYAEDANSQSIGNQRNQIEKEIEELKSKINKSFDAFYIKTLLSGKYDSNDAIVSITSGAGGTESNDWADILLRMYTRFCEQSDYKMIVTDYLAGDVAGVKSVSFNISGGNAFGMLKSENGVHRLVRISPFDSNARRHTSFAAVEVVPVIEKTDLVVDDKDLRIDVYRASGAGGQHVNKTESAVRITHIPTNIVVTCQDGRSQISNRETAMKNLISKLAFLQHQAEVQNLKSITGVQNKIEWGSQIRSYVMCPYTMVKDHRTGEETSNVDKVLDGDLTDFINAFLIGKKIQK